MSLFSTSVSINTPSVVEYGNPVEISGKLEWYCPPVMCPPFGGWRPYGGATVNIIVDGVKRQSVVTSQDGSFYTTLLMPIGTHVVEAYYPGSWKDEPSEAKTEVTVLSPSEYRSYLFRQDIIYAGLGVVVPLLLYALLRR